MDYTGWRHVSILLTRHYSIRAFCEISENPEVWLKVPHVVSNPWMSNHYNDVIMGAMSSQITSLTIGYSTVYSRRRSKKTSKLRITGLCEGNSPVTGEFPAQRASKEENISIWWRHHVKVSGISLNRIHFAGSLPSIRCLINRYRVAFQKATKRLFCATTCKFEKCYNRIHNYCFPS